MALPTATGSTTNATGGLNPAAYVITAADLGYADGDLDALASISVESLPGAGDLYYDPDGSSNAVLTAVHITGGSSAVTVTAANIGLGRLTFVPDASPTGTGYASFTFKVTSVTPDTSNPAVGVTSAAVATLTFDIVAGNATVGTVFVGTIAEGVSAVSAQATHTDADNTDDVFQVIAAGTASVSGYGTYQVAANGTWTYTLNSAHTTINALGAGQSTSDTFTIYTEDGTTQTVTITINGTNDTPTLVAASPGTDAGAVTEDLAASLVQSFVSVTNYF